jgi:uncharacterized protein YjbI with pentapeptide repeats
MADREHLYRLTERGITEWNAWRSEAVDVPIDLANLRDANLSKADLSHVHLRRADLRGADLHEGQILAGQT